MRSLATLWIAALIGAASGGCGGAEADPPHTPVTARACGSADSGEREASWSKLTKVVRARASVPAMDAGAACETARSFATTCPTWDPNTLSAERVACGVALKEDIGALEESLVMTLKGSSLEPLKGDPWGTPRTFASSLARFQSLASPAPDDARLLAAAQGMMRDSQRFDTDVERLNSSCADIAELEKAMKEVGTFTASRFQRIIAIRRNTEIELGQRRIHAMTSKEYSATDAPGVVQKDLDAAHKMPTEMQCYDATVAKQADADVTRWSAKVEADLAARKKPPR